jgi:hypothetical protein
MEKITHAPLYVALYPRLAEIAREHGYSLAIHGSVGRSAYSDFDLVAIPWTDEAVDQEILLAALSNYCRIMMDPLFKDAFMENIFPVNKPHGRKAWIIQLGNGSVLDISVMPLGVS